MSRGEGDCSWDGMCSGGLVDGGVSAVSIDVRDVVPHHRSCRSLFARDANGCEASIF